MLEDYLNETVEAEIVINLNESNEPDEVLKAAIPARVEEKIRNIRNRQGVEVISNTTVYITYKLSNNDKLLSRPILSIEPLKGLDGVLGYKVYL